LAQSHFRAWLEKESSGIVAKNHVPGEKEFAISTPVVFLIFNRPDLTEQVFAAIRQARTSRLLLVADGPRPDRPGEADKCAATRALVEKVNWPCDVIKNYSDSNLGCRQRVASGLTWAFEQVEEAIVLEDDCLPHPSFFQYCADLLNRFRNDQRILSITGDNFQQGHWRGPGSYYFSRYQHCWGWATWRSAWRYFDLSFSLWPALRDSGALHNICPDGGEHDFWHGIFEAMHAGKINTWDFAWHFAGVANNKVSIHPNVNLISNIGFRSDATHTLDTSPNAELETSDIGPLRHPPFMVPDRAADLFAFKAAHGAVAAPPQPPNHRPDPPSSGGFKHRLLRPLAALCGRS
jgi:hypothetical protein